MDGFAARLRNCAGPVAAWDRMFQSGMNTYAHLTRDDPSRIKSFLQRRRLRDAIGLVSEYRPARRIIDYGAADGEFCKLLTEQFPEADICCFEPAASLRSEAAGNLAGLGRITIIDSTASLENGSCDLLFCMEVLEHLPADTVERSILEMKRLLRPGGIAVVGVPIEIYVPALLKGFFRMTRRYGAFDARPGNVLRAGLGFPPQPRPVSEIEQGLPYHHEHLGFDHRSLGKLLRREFSLVRTMGSPVGWLGSLLNSELYFVVRKGD
jgi:SAM-dependent methyltransferase